jgi:hypothetical protein
MQDQIETIGMLIVKGVVLPLVGLFVAWASMMLPAWIKAKVKNESVAGVLERLSQLAFSVVTEIQQTIVSGLGDKATSEELLKARDLAIANLKSHLGTKGLKELMTVLGLADDAAVTKLLITFIESAVHNLPKTLMAGALLETKTTTTPETATEPVTTPVTTTAST